MITQDELCVIASWDDLGLGKEEVDGYVEKLLSIVVKITEPGNWDVSATLASG